MYEVDSEVSDDDDYEVAEDLAACASCSVLIPCLMVWEGEPSLTILSIVFIIVKSRFQVVFALPSESGSVIL